jgi:hypothetical protein
VEWGNANLTRLAAGCQGDDDCKIVQLGCPWGCGTAIHRNADA